MDFSKSGDEKVPEKKEANPLMSSMSAVSLTSIWIQAEMRAVAGTRSQRAPLVRKVSFFFPAADRSPHLAASVTIVPMPSAKSSENILGTLDENDT